MAGTSVGLLLVTAAVLIGCATPSPVAPGVVLQFTRNAPALARSDPN